MPQQKQNELDRLLAQRVQKEQRQQKPPAARAPAAPKDSPNGVVRWIDIAVIDDNPNQPPGRIAIEQLQEMIDGMGADGQMQPAEVRPHPNRPGRFQLVYGHRRKAAVKAGANAGIKQPEPQRFIGQLMCLVNPEVSDLEMIRRAARENNSRLEMTPLQTAQLYVRMREETTREMTAHGHVLKDGKLATWRQVAEWNGYGANKYSDLQRVAALLELPDWAQRELEPDPDKPDKYVLNSRHGRALGRFQNEPKQQRQLLRAIQRERLSGSEADRRADEMKPKPPAVKSTTSGTNTTTQSTLSGSADVPRETESTTTESTESSNQDTQSTLSEDVLQSTLRPLVSLAAEGARVMKTLSVTRDYKRDCLREIERARKFLDEMEGHLRG